MNSHPTYHQIKEQQQQQPNQQPIQFALPYILPSPINIAYFSPHSHKRPRTAPAPASVYNSVRNTNSVPLSFQVPTYSAALSPVTASCFSLTQPTLQNTLGDSTFHTNQAFPGTAYSFSSGPFPSRKRRRKSCAVSNSTLSICDDKSSLTPASLSQIVRSLKRESVTIAQLKEIASKFGIERSGKKSELFERLQKSAEISTLVAHDESGYSFGWSLEGIGNLDEKIGDEIELDKEPNNSALKSESNEPSPAFSLSSFLNLEGIISDKPVQTASATDTESVGSKITSPDENMFGEFSLLADMSISQNSREDSSLYGLCFK